MPNANLQRMKLQVLSLLAPKVAGKIATQLFSQSRNEANEFRKALTPMGARCEKISSPDHRVENVYIWGDSGDIVLLVHGWGANCSSMFGFVQPLLDDGYRVATFDGPAHGCTPGEYATMWEYVTAAKDVIQHLGDVRFIVAHSLGGIVAMAAAAGDPKVERIALISAPFSLMDVLDIWSGNSMKLPTGIRERVLAQLLEDNGVPVSYWDIGLHGKDWTKPVYVIHDEDDDVVGSNHADQIKQVFKDSKLSLTQGLGHAKILMNQNVHNLVNDFISQKSEQREAVI